MNKDEQIKVLIVDDDEEDYLIIKDLLSRLPEDKHDVRWAQDYKRALKAVEESDYSAYLIDYRLGGEDGLELVRELVASGHDVPIIMLTGQGSLEIDLEASRAGAVDYLVKDELSPTLLERAIRYAIQGHVAMVALRESESELRQAQKMDALGQLAGGVSHDFNNILHVISGYANLAAGRKGPGAELDHDISQILVATNRATDLVKQLLTFARKGEVSMQAVDLGKLVENMRDMLARLISKNIQVNYSIPEDPLVVIGDEGQLEQVVLNLAINARDAIGKENGELALQLESLVLDRGKGEKDYAVLRVSDTGHGMSPDTRIHLFEPFFTTKDKDKGTGLGLSTVYGIINLASGDIEVASEVGVGTTFVVYLPIADENDTAKTKADTS